MSTAPDARVCPGCWRTESACRDGGSACCDLCQHNPAPPEPTNRVMSAISRAVDTGAEVYTSGGAARIEFTEDVFERWFLAEAERIAARPAPLLPPRPMTDDEAAEFERKWAAAVPARASRSAGEPQSPTGGAGDGREPSNPARAISAAQGERLVPVTLVPVQVFGTECGTCEEEFGYGLMDAVPAWSDCNRAHGRIYRRDDDSNVPHRQPGDVITVYVPKSQVGWFDKKFDEEGQ